MGEGVVLNSKSEFNRSSLPRIISVDTPEVETLGDSDELVDVEEGTLEDEDFGGEDDLFIVTGKNHSKSELRKMKQKNMTDVLRWGKGPEEGMEEELSTEEDEESLIDLFIIFLEEAEVEVTEVTEAKKMIQTNLETWRGNVKFSSEVKVTLEKEVIGRFLMLLSL